MALIDDKCSSCFSGDQSLCLIPKICLPCNVKQMVVSILVEPHSRLQTVNQSLQSKTIRALLHQLLYLHQHGLESGLSFYHTTQSFWKDDLSKIGV